MRIPRCMRHGFSPSCTLRFNWLCCCRRCFGSTLVSLLLFVLPSNGRRSCWQPSRSRHCPPPTTSRFSFCLWPFFVHISCESAVELCSCLSLRFILPSGTRDGTRRRRMVGKLF